MRYPVAAIQFEPQFGAKSQNLTLLTRLTEEAARAGARLIVLPEMAATGYCFQNRAEIAPLVEAVPDGPTTQECLALARRLGVYLVVGLPEVDPATNIYYNTAVLLGPEGYLGKYRKLHSFIDETRWARDGDLGVPVFDTALGRIGIMICMDADFPETARLAAVAGAEILAFPNNWLGDQTPWFARAAENGLYLVSANRWGEERGVKFCGHTAVIDPEGQALNLLTGGDGICLADIDLTRSRGLRMAAMALRRPELYQDLVIHSHLWRPKDAFALPVGRPVVVATGTATDPERMADQARWADRQVRDRDLPGLDLMLFPPGEAGEAAADAMVAVAAGLDCHLVWGTPTGAWLAGPAGVVARYRAVHGGDGDQFTVVDLAWGRLGLAAGLDLRVPEAARLLAKQGADLIAAPVALASDADRLLWKARWIENDTALAVAAPDGIGAIHGARPKAVPALDSILIGLVDTGSERIRAKEMLRKLQPFWYVPLTR